MLTEILLVSVRTEARSTHRALSKALFYIQCTSHIVGSKQSIKACTGKSAQSQDYRSSRAHHNARNINFIDKKASNSGTGGLPNIRVRLCSEGKYIH